MQSNTADLLQWKTGVKAINSVEKKQCISIKSGLRAEAEGLARSKTEMPFNASKQAICVFIFAGELNKTAPASIRT